MLLNFDEQRRGAEEKSWKAIEELTKVLKESHERRIERKQEVIEIPPRDSFEQKRLEIEERRLRVEERLMEEKEKNKVWRQKQDDEELDRLRAKESLRKKEELEREKELDRLREREYLRKQFVLRDDYYR